MFFLLIPAIRHIADIQAILLTMKFIREDIENLIRVGKRIETMIVSFINLLKNISRINGLLIYE
jgi:hypothetical protein